MTMSGKLAGNGMKVAESVANTAGAAAKVIANGSMIVEHSTGLVSNFAEHAIPAGKPLGKIATDTLTVGSHITAAAAAPAETAELAIKAAVTPVNRLLKTFTLAVNGLFDKIDSKLAPLPLELKAV